MDRIAAMGAFVTVAELRGFAPAARRLGISPSAVTRLVAMLEDHLAVRLLHRTTRTVALTDAGARYLERARRILAELEDADAAARAERAEPFGRFVVAAPRVFGRREVTPLMSDFLAKHPSVEGELSLSDRVVNLTEDGVDLAVRIGVLEDSSLRARAVGATRRVLVASPRYLAKRSKLRRPDDLSSHATILFTSLTPLPEWRFFGNQREERAAIRPSFVTNSADAAIAHAEKGFGLTLVLSYQVVDLLRAGRLEVVLSRFEPPPIPIQLVYPGGRYPSASVRAFIELTVATRKWDFVDL
jgi:DNA-binding transcriptional LysR family regulator